MSGKGGWTMKPGSVKQFTDYDSAYGQLYPNFVDNKGVLSPKPGYKPTMDDYAAVDYLCDEWDYGYEENFRV